MDCPTHDALMDVLENPDGVEGFDLLRRYGLGLLPALSTQFSRDLPFATVELLESVLKSILLDYFTGKVTGGGARQIVRFQLETGFILKYKPYTIKAANPLGYSLFFHTPGKGFSFQRHVEHKTEVFHILQVYEGGYVFVCDYSTWRRIYDRESFAAWLAGEKNESYDQCRFHPQPGDVISIDRLNVVHSVVGCILEEFATTSVDMVDRLHDPNERNGVPTRFTRSFAYEKIRSVDPPPGFRRVAVSGNGIDVRRIDPVETSGCVVTPLAETVFSAHCLVLNPSRSTELYYERSRATSAFVFAGHGCLLLGDEAEVQAVSPPAIELQRGDLVTIPNKVFFRFTSGVDGPFCLSTFAIPIDISLRSAGTA